MRKEAKFQTLFRHWLKQNPLISGAFELKQTGSALPFDAVSEHQIHSLLAAKGKSGILYKAPDDTIGAKPFDMFYLRNAQAWIVVKYPKGFEIIDVDTFLLEKKKSKRKSLTYSIAKQISVISVKL